MLPLLLVLLFRPAWGIVCYHCDSIALPECAQTLGEVGQLPYKECATELTCAMSIVASITYRGCGAETPTTQATYSKRCSSNLCNTGVYPPGRLKCHHCAGAECVAAPVGKPRPCRLHHEVDEDQCYTEIVNATYAYRGCKSDTNHTASGLAQLCEINGCNAQQGARILTCARCDSREALGCKRDLFQLNSARCNISLYDQCEQQLLLGHAEEQHYCFTYHQHDRVVRGCSTQLPVELEAQREQLVQCNAANNCNVGCIAAPRCISCSSTEQELCRSNASALSSITCGSPEASCCYACVYDDWQVRRGCGAPPEQSSLQCYECDGNALAGCNRMDYTRCYRCSSDDGAGCANWQQPGGIYIEQCAQLATPCLALNYANGTTERGCWRDNFNCNAADVASCRQCDGSFCNTGAFPEHRLWCHQCSGNCEHITQGQTALPCTRLANEPADQLHDCLEYYDQFAGQVVRGCRSNALLYYECMLHNGHAAACRLCTTPGCNATPGEELRA
ncbi:hypothetical protein KR222_011161, partial [Zaprionus bogoriensis]